MMDVFSILLRTATIPNEMINPTETEKIGYILKITLIGVGVVFAVLFIIMAILYLLQLFCYKIPQIRAEKTKEVQVYKEEIKQVESESTDDEEDIAAIMAAISVYCGNQSVSKYKIRSFKRIKS